MSWVIGILGICFLCIVGVFLYNLIQILKYPKVDDEYQYMSVRLERYTNVIHGDTKEISIWKDLYKINVNFRYFLVSDQMIYLFDGNKRLFAICDKNKKTTHLFNFRQTLKVFDEFESQFNGCRTKPGDVVISPFHHNHIC